MLPDQFVAATAAAKKPLDLMSVVGAPASVSTVLGTTAGGLSGHLEARRQLKCAVPEPCHGS